MLRHPYRLADIVPFRGPRHTGFSARLLRDDRDIARVLDEGNSGPLVWSFLGAPSDAEREAEALDRYAEALPMEADESFEQWCRDSFTVRLFEDHRTMRALQSRAKSRMVLLVPHIQKGHVPVVLPFPYDPSVRGLVLRRYGNGTLILNELPGMTWPGPSRRPASGLGRGEEVVLGTTRDAPNRSPPAGGPPQRVASLVGRDVRLPGWDISYS